MYLASTRHKRGESAQKLTSKRTVHSPVYQFIALKKTAYHVRESCVHNFDSVVRPENLPVL